MQQDFMNVFNDFGKQAYASAVALGEIHTELAGDLIAQQLDFANTCVETGVKQLKAAQSSKDAKDYFSSQTQLVQEYTDKLMALAKNQASLAQTAGEKYQAWFEQGIKQANGASKTVAKKVQAASSA